MTYVLPLLTIKRSSLLSIVIGLHVGVLLMIMATKTVVPQILEIPIIIDLLEAPEAEKPPAAKPLPMAPPTPVKQHHQPREKTPTPPIEATSSSVEAASAPTTTSLESKPATTQAAAETPFTEARFDANYLQNPAPKYPPLSRKMGEEGKVVLRVLVNQQGAADQVQIKTSSGSQRLDESAQKTVRNWKFIPAKQGTEPIESWVLVPIIFKLEQ